MQRRPYHPCEQRIGEMASDFDDVGRKPDTAKPCLPPCRVVPKTRETRIFLDIGVERNVDPSSATVGLFGVPIALPDIGLHLRIGRRRERRKLLGAVSGVRNIGGRPGRFGNPCGQQRDETEAERFNPTGKIQ